MGRAKLTGGLALLCPPVVVLASVHDLFLRSQQDLGSSLSPLVRFWVASAAAVLLAAAVRRGTGPAARRTLGLYYTAGLAFLAWSLLRALPFAGHLVRWILDSGPGAIAFVALSLGGGLVLLPRLNARDVERPLAILALVLVGREAFFFATRLEHQAPRPRRDVAAEMAGGGGGESPNVYHLVLDSFQDELFEPCLPDDAADVFRGFRRFHAVAPVQSTVYMMPAALTGRWLDGLKGGATPRVKEALVGEDGLPQVMRGAGYRTLAYVPGFFYKTQPGAFDHTVFHDENVEPSDVRELQSAKFLRRWLYLTLPLALSEVLARGRWLGAGEGLFDLTSLTRLSTIERPVMARLSTERLIEDEPRLPGRGRYTFAHVALPHAPYLLRANCDYGSGPTDLEQQTRCTLALLVRFLRTLDRLGRLDESVVVVHGDHGSDQVLREGRLVRDEGAKHRTLLLVKPAGARGPMRVAGEQAQLVDVAPTLLAVLGVSPRPGFDGHVLAGGLDDPASNVTPAGSAGPDAPPADRRGIGAGRGQ